MNTLTNASVTTMLPVIDMARARAFYEGCLGLHPGGFNLDGKFVYSVEAAPWRSSRSPKEQGRTTRRSASR